MARRRHRGGKRARAKKLGRAMKKCWLKAKRAGKGKRYVYKCVRKALKK